MNGVNGAGFDAIAAEHAQSQIDVEALGPFFNDDIRTLLRDNAYALRGAYGLAEHASRAARVAILALKQAVAATRTAAQDGGHVRILDGDRARLAARSRRL